MKKILILVVLSLSTSALSNILFAEVVVYPDKPTAVTFSNSGTNRIVCNGGNVADVFYSQNKGMIAEVIDNNVFLQYQHIQLGTQKQLINERGEIHIVCADQVYTLITVPKQVHAKIVYLNNYVTDKVKKNISLFNGMSREEMIVSLTKAVISDQYPETFSVKSIDKPLLISDITRSNHYIYNWSNIVLRKEVRPEGTGVVAHEYTIDVFSDMELTEAFFIDPLFGENIMAITLFNHDQNDPGSEKHFIKLTKGDQMRVIIISGVHHEQG